MNIYETKNCTILDLLTESLNLVIVPGQILHGFLRFLFMVMRILHQLQEYQSYPARGRNEKYRIYFFLRPL